MKDNPRDAASGRAQTNIADRPGAQPCVTIIAGQPASGRWWDAPYREKLVPAAWSPTGLVECMKSVQIPALGGQIVPYSNTQVDKRLVRNYSFVALAIRSFDAAGNRVDLPQPVQDTIRREALRGLVPGSLIVTRRGQAFVIFLLSRPIKDRERREGKAVTADLFYLASKGAEWLVEEALKNLQVVRAHPAVQTGCAGARSRSIEGAQSTGVRNFIRMVNGMAVQALLSNSRGVPLDCGILASTETEPTEYLTLAEKLWQPEELASYAPAVPVRPHDAIWDLVRALRDETLRKKAKTRLRNACEELAGRCISEIDGDWPASIESSIEELGRFATAWSDADAQLVSAGLPPLGAGPGSNSSAVLSYDSIWDPASTFRLELRRRLASGDWHIALRDGGVPHGLGTSPRMLGWTHRKNDQCRGGTTWMSSGLCVGWIDYRKRELLLDVEAITRDFASRGRGRCACLCMKPARLARILAEAGLLAPSSDVICRRKVLGESHKVIRMRLDSVPFDSVSIANDCLV